MQLSGPSIAAAPGNVSAANGPSSSQSVPSTTPGGAKMSPKPSLSASLRHALGTDSFSAAPGNVVDRVSSQSSPPRIVGSSSWVSAQPMHATYRSPSPSVSSSGGSPEQLLLLPSQTSGAPG